MRKPGRTLCGIYVRGLNSYISGMHINPLEFICIRLGAYLRRGFSEEVFCF